MCVSPAAEASRGLRRRDRGRCSVGAASAPRKPAPRPDARRGPLAALDRSSTTIARSPGRTSGPPTSGGRRRRSPTGAAPTAATSSGRSTPGRAAPTRARSAGARRDPAHARGAAAAGAQPARAGSPTGVSYSRAAHAAPARIYPGRVTRALRERPRRANGRADAAALAAAKRRGRARASPAHARRPPGGPGAGSATPFLCIHRYEGAWDVEHRATATTAACRWTGRSSASTAREFVAPLGHGRQLAGLGPARGGGARLPVRARLQALAEHRPGLRLALEPPDQ